MTAIPAPGAHVLITGATGFLGKVVLAELIRLGDTYGLARVYVLIRPKKGRLPELRFADDLIPSPAFRLLPDGWWDCCEAVAGDVSQDRLGLAGADWDRLTANVTHIIHCAASIEFDLPLAAAANANIAGALAVLDLAKACTRLARFVDVSTAYVSPHGSPGVSKVIGESLEVLPFDVSTEYQSILAGQCDQTQLMARTGHPNTYTVTKCMAEILLAERRGNVPLVIVRPSIISACWQYPFPGWIDSRAAFAGFVSLYAMGYLRVIAGDPRNRLDIVPCDEVAQRILQAAFEPLPEPPGVLPIRFAVAGLSQSCTVREITAAGFPFFRRTGAPVRQELHTEPSAARLKLLEWWQHRLPTKTAQVALSLVRRSRDASDAGRLHDILVYLNRAFPFFTTREYDFQATWPLAPAGYTPVGYIEAIYAGVSRHLLRRESDQIPFAGKRHQARKPGVVPATGMSAPNTVMRSLGAVLGDAFGRCLDVATFDEPSFQAAVTACKAGEGVILVPSHRSYLDYLLFPYLLLVRPDLGLPMPHIAVTDDFARLPVVGRLLRAAQAFFIRRGLGLPDPELATKVRDLVKNGQVITFFIEGRRSRSRRFLSPRRGLLRALQETGQSFVVLPVAITYDRIPEEAVFVRELTGGPPSRTGLKPLFTWMGALRRGKVKLGRAHIACGTPLRLTPTTDVPALGAAIRQELHRRTVATTFHLAAFLAQQALPGLSVAWLRHAIERRGGSVLDSPLKDGAAVSALVERTMQMQWSHWFIGDALALAPGNPALQQFARQHGHPDPRPGPVPTDERLLCVLTALFGPVMADYRLLAATVAAETGPDGVTRDRLLTLCRAAYQPDIEDAVADLVVRRILQETSDRLTWGERADDLPAYLTQMSWPCIGANPVGGDRSGSGTLRGCRDVRSQTVAQVHPADAKPGGQDEDGPDVPGGAVRAGLLDGPSAQ
ncbi:MAG: SDR family oxidoreductase [Candidatus Sericytochromatia bacterium]|nr:SDR family oxidoreductase [Candidatus Sericytochromatia bacterium]